MLSDLAADLWYGIMAPAGTPREAVQRLNDAFARALTAPDVLERLAALGFEAAPGTPERLGDIHRNDVVKYGKLIRDAGIKGE